ncbi:MAG: hypothetical protein ACO1OQ_14445 [Rufibacter sp.]
MSLKDIFNKITHEVKAAKGEEAKDKVFFNENSFTDETTAQKEFERAKAKLFDVNGWSKLRGINSTFTLHDSNGQAISKPQPAIGDFVRIILPASTFENWVQVVEIKESDTAAEFTVKPSPEPVAQKEGAFEVKHFFTSEASSTFRVERQGSKIIGYEIGQHERVNNTGEEAGNRAVLNTLVAEGGWAGFQDIQWNRLTAYLVHLEEAPEEE